MAFLRIGCLLAGMLYGAAAAGMPKPPLPAPLSESGLGQAIFAGGCLWCLEPVFDALPGVTRTQTGYIAGATDQPTFKQVEAGGSGHYFATRVTFDPAVVSYAELLERFWLNIDPFDGEGQFCDRGAPFRPAIFSIDDSQQKLALQSMARLQQSRPDNNVATAVLPGEKFYEAQPYYQDFYLQHPKRYQFYLGGCDRMQRLRQINLQPHEFAPAQ